MHGGALNKFHMWIQIGRPDCWISARFFSLINKQQSVRLTKDDIDLDNRKIHMVSIEYLTT